MIRYTSVSKKFKNGHLAVSEINLEIPDGEFIFLIGPSGAGKTTLLKLLHRQLTPTQGTIHMDDVIVSRLEGEKIAYQRRKIGYVFQDFKLLADRTVAENMAVVLQILGKRKQEIDRKISEVLTFLKLDGKEDTFPAQLSLGEQQRVAIGRAILGGTKVLLADEPTGNLDQEIAFEILKIIADINATGVTVIMATHNAEIVNKMQKRVVALDKGRVVKDRKKSRYGE